MSGEWVLPWRSVLALLLSSAVIMGSPGPSTMSVTAVGAVYGFRRSLRYASGLVFGTPAVLLTVAAGVVAVLLSFPRGARVLLVISAAYMLYPAFRIATAPPLNEIRELRAVPALWGGFMLAIASPKAYLAIGAVFAGTSLFADHAVDAAAKVALLAAMIVAIHLCWLLVGATFARILRDPVSSRMPICFWRLALSPR